MVTREVVTREEKRLQETKNGHKTRKAVTRKTVIREETQLEEKRSGYTVICPVQPHVVLLVIEMTARVRDGSGTEANHLVSVPIRREFKGPARFPCQRRLEKRR